MPHQVISNPEGLLLILLVNRHTLNLNVLRLILCEVKRVCARSHITRLQTEQSLGANIPNSAFRREAHGKPGFTGSSEKELRSGSPGSFIAI